MATAYYITGIPNIEVYVPMAPKHVKWMKRANWVRPVLALRPVQALLKRQAGKLAGPDEKAMYPVRCLYP